MASRLNILGMPKRVWMPGGYLSSEPIPTKSLSPDQEDLTGQSRGALTVVGYVGEGRWSMRCICGYYTMRYARTIKRKNHDDMCPSCQRELALFRKDFLTKNGRYPYYWELPA